MHCRTVSLCASPHGLEAAGVDARPDEVVPHGRRLRRRQVERRLFLELRVGVCLDPDPVLLGVVEEHVGDLVEREEGRGRELGRRAVERDGQIR